MLANIQESEMTEEWRDIKNYEGLYQVSNFGRVKSLEREVSVKRGKLNYVVALKSRILKPITRQHGYLGVQLYCKENSKHVRGLRTFSIHRLVAEAFLDNPNDLLEVNHKDEDKTNNRVDNLEWIDHKGNSSFGTRGKRIGLANTNGKQSKAVVQLTLGGAFIAEYPSLAEVERSLGFSKGNVWLCVMGKRHASYGYRWKYA